MIRYFLLLSSFAFSMVPAFSAIEEHYPEICSRLAGGTEPVKVICFGDSVTGVYYHTGGRRAYCDMVGIALTRIFPESKVEMVNAGISGNTTTAALGRIERDVLSRKADLVTVMFGLNDVVKTPIEDYRKNLVEIIDRCRNAGSRVLLCTPNAVVSTDARPVAKLEEYCEVVREVAREKKVYLCDLYAHFLSLRKQDQQAWRDTLSDEIHPNMAGHKIMAEQIAESVSGKKVSLLDVPPPSPVLQKTLALLEGDKPIRILAMPPFDSIARKSLLELFPEAPFEVTPWQAEGMTMYQLRKDASHRVRKMKPDLVLVAVPPTATAKDRAGFFHEQAWIVNYSLSFGKQEWDLVVVHPSVANPTATSPETDQWIRAITRAQDLTLLDRSGSDRRSAEVIFLEWLESQLSGSTRQ